MADPVASAEEGKVVSSLQLREEEDWVGRTAAAGVKVDTDSVVNDN